MLHSAHFTRRWKQWLALPLSAVLLGTMACEKAAEPATPVTSTALDSRVASPPPVVYSSVEQMPEYPGGSAQLTKDLDARISPLFPTAAAKVADLNGKILIEYVVDANGILCAIALKKAATPKPGQEAVLREVNEAGLQAVRELEAHWKPGYHNGKAVAVRGTLMFAFLSTPYKITGSSKITQSKWYAWIWGIK